jgi:hypothetical protein
MTKYIGAQPATSFEAVKKDRFTGLTGTGVTLSHSVTSVQDVVVWVNNVKQDYNNYTVSNTALTLGGSLVSSDVVQVLYVGRTFQTVNPSAASVGNNEVASTIITGQTAETSIATDDLILLSDTSASGALKKMTRANFVSGIGGDNLPIFAVSKSGGSNQTINHGSSTKVTFSHEITDPSSAFASDKFTVPSGKDGTYLFAWNLQIEDSDSAIVRLSTNLYKNGSVISSGQMRSEGGDTAFANYTITQTRIVPAAAADYFEVYIYQESSNGSSVILEASTSHNQFFSGTKLIT